MPIEKLHLLARDILLKLYRKGLSGRKIAKMLNVPPHTVYAISYNRPFSTNIALRIIHSAGYEVIIKKRSEESV